MGRFSGIPWALIFFIIQTITLLFVVLAGFLDVLQSLHSIGCYTAWGYVEHCAPPATHAYAECPEMRPTMCAASAFALISLFLATVSCVLGGLRMLACIVLKPWGTLTLSGAIALTLLVSWACIAGVQTKLCGRTHDGAFEPTYEYAAGFRLLLLGWIMQVLATGVAALMVFM
ncbi:amastin-like surface protein-like protein [Trypanosoma conorhini]|uniref:Amastin-like surface protein-like protein n=1 Tax=Trypanosoma conorhini TaxID=83891 RepID=A0A3R7P4I0_9TRYP|nr:amastin-like surface protein-like protein [Trypanosoma conorhini]RNF12608.1 amastin-like surface protein-like protein [Trypanosoma conorhini]